MMPYQVLHVLEHMIRHHTGVKCTCFLSPHRHQLIEVHSITAQFEFFWDLTPENWDSDQFESLCAQIVLTM